MRHDVAILKAGCLRKLRDFITGTFLSDLGEELVAVIALMKFCNPKRKAVEGLCLSVSIHRDKFSRTLVVGVVPTEALEGLSGARVPKSVNCLVGFVGDKIKEAADWIVRLSYFRGSDRRVRSVFPRPSISRLRVTKLFGGR